MMLGQCLVWRGKGRFVVIVIALVVSGLCVLARAAPSKSESNAALRIFLQRYFKVYGSVVERDLRYSVASVSLNGNSKHQLFVYLPGRWSCGSGGCVALLLEPRDSSFRVIDRFTLVRLPIRILPSKTHGWHDLAMPVEGGGIFPGHFVILRFNGHSYPSNPSMAPKLPGKLAGSGTEVPLSRQGSLVY
jgi:hypothetical protein